MHSSRIDGFLFAESAGVLRGIIPVADFPRLQDMLSSPGGGIAYEVIGIPKEAGRPALHVSLSGPLKLTCQRCLGVLEFALQVDEVLVLARTEAEIEAQPVDPESPDRILGGKEMAVGAMLEDEILLAVPFAPHHQECSEAGEDRIDGSRDSPFANLRGLLDRGGRTRN
ncbi:MAG: DUF177 domain-containing protein [Betaproteobacteria bacterium]